MFTGDEDQQIELAEAATMNENYRNANPGQTLGHYFSRRTLMAILNQDTSVGARIYYAQSTDGEKELVIVGVNEDENDLYEGFIGDRTYKSPPHGGANNALNS